MGQPPRAKVEHVERGGVRWELATRPLPAVLQPWLAQCEGYGERAPGRVERRELPGPRVVLIVELGAPIAVHDAADEARQRTFPGGFVAGLGDRSTLTSHAGFQRGVQIDLTPTGARRCFGVPLHELRDRVVGLDELLPPARRGLAEQLMALSSWDERLDRVQAWLAEPIATSRVDVRVVDWAVRRIEASGGAVDTRTLARELGYSEKHVIALFHEQVGLTPRRFARVVRFDRLVRHLRAGGGGSWAELAARFGWFDQSHLAKELKRIVGVPLSQARELLGAAPGNAAPGNAAPADAAPGGAAPATRAELA